ncbi:hypothetical protein [Brevibacillus sp. SAFN-007a]|uniref:hypothetical protein n=1 Tax=Brevibacillus sp. SAFN-007a TaxID=3436862 RepID=UPI003F7F71B9
MVRVRSFDEAKEMRIALLLKQSAELTELERKYGVDPYHQYVKYIKDEMSEEEFAVVFHWILTQNIMKASRIKYYRTH